MAEIRPELLARFGNDADALEWARWHVQRQVDWLKEASELPAAGPAFAHLATWCAGFMRDTLIGNRSGYAAFDERSGEGSGLPGFAAEPHQVTLTVRGEDMASYGVRHPSACHRLAYGERCEFDLAVTGAGSLLPRELGVYDVTVTGDIVEFTWVRALAPEDPMADEPCVHERENTSPLGRFFFLTGLPCAECEAEAHTAWVEGVRAKLAAGLESAARGERFDWDAPEPDDDEPPFALIRLDDRIDLALTIGDDGRCTIPAAGRYSFPRMAMMQGAIDAEHYERVMQRVRDGVMTLEQARQAYTRVESDYAPLFPSGIGGVLHEWLRPDPQPGPPWVHTFAAPRCDLDDCCETDEPCECACHRPQPTHTITFDTSEATDA